MIKLVVLFALVAVASAGVIAPIVPVAHPVVHHVAPVVPVASVHSAVVHHRPIVHAPLVHAPLVHAPLVHAAPVVPIVKHHSPILLHH
ncbi:unnamed protein product [Pieris macdunnoughi]|uniref:Uncharacterized protein n=1 Tax=Pieris macdunnoughi TaxID=345717 RepID=A0A821V470_9NEOP|nr:unnamed protein product [Pieris macdunnoughi]